MRIIVGIEKNTNGIGMNNSLVLRLKSDLKHFQKITSSLKDEKKYNVIIMGKKTYLSIATHSFPLKNRLNIVLSKTSTDNFDKMGAKKFNSIDNCLEFLIKKNKEIETVFVIGGASIYTQFLNRGLVDEMYITYINCKFTSRITFDTFLDLKPYIDDEFNLISSKPGLEFNVKNHITKEIYQSIPMSFNHYKYINKGELGYLNLMLKIKNHGEKRNTRSGMVRSLFGEKLEFDNIYKNFPLLTTKKVYFKGVVEELLFFLRGDTDTKKLEAKGVNIWKGNTSKEFLKKLNLNYDEGDMGPMYGFNWRFFNAKYINAKTEYKGQGFNQLEYIINLIKTDPTSRRIFLTGWNPSVLNESVLACCHVSYQFFVSEGKYLSCHMYQRSCDLGCGLPFNIASTALFTSILANICDLIPKKVIISFGDIHIYENHIEAIDTQLGRIPNKFPILKINKKITSIDEELKYNDFTLINYKHQGTIKMKMAI